VTTTPTAPALAAPADTLATAEAERRAALAFVEANRIDVCDLVTLTRAGTVRTAIGEKVKAITAKLAAPKAAAFALHRWICGLEAAALAPYELLDAYEREQIRTFHDAQSRARQQRERELAEQRRREDEARAAAEAAALERAGEHDLADAVMEEAIAAPLPVVVLADEVKAIQKFRRSWKWRLVKPELVPREFLIVDTVRLNKYATAMRESAQVPGVEFYPVDEPIR
jgi:hypothetical protein